MLKINFDTNTKGENEIDRVFNILVKCIHEVHHGDKIYNAVDVTEKDLETFIEELSRAVD